VGRQEGSGSAVGGVRRLGSGCGARVCGCIGCGVSVAGARAFTTGGFGGIGAACAELLV
jgi:hypothetical protein